MIQMGVYGFLNRKIIAWGPSGTKLVNVIMKYSGKLQAESQKLKANTELKNLRTPFNGRGK